MSILIITDTKSNTTSGSITGRAANSAGEAQDKKFWRGPHVEVVYHKNLNGMDDCFLFNLQKVEVKIVSISYTVYPENLAIFV